jgi:hypothetical protein
LLTGEPFDVNKNLQAVKPDWETVSSNGFFRHFLSSLSLWRHIVKYDPVFAKWSIDFAGNESACETGKLVEESILFIHAPVFKKWRRLVCYVLICNNSVIIDLYIKLLYGIHGRVKEGFQRKDTKNGKYTQHLFELFYCKSWL